MRVVFVNRFYSPDLSATSQMLTDLAEALASSGQDVMVVCSRQLYEDPRAALPAREVLRGVTVHRIATARFGRGRLIGRALDYVTFYLAAAFSLLKVVRSSDVLVVKTDPPLLSLVGAFVAACRGARLINWLQDVYPEVASRLALSPLPRCIEAVLRGARDASLKAAHLNVVLGTRMREYLLQRGVPAPRIHICENWADEAAVQPLPITASLLRRRLGLEDRFVVAYSGNLGRAHDVDTLLNAAVLLSEDPDFVFLMIGGGVNMRVLEAQVRQRKLTNFHFFPYQPREALSDSLAAADVHLVSLLPVLEGLIVPSKLYGILAAARPVVFVGDPDGELARIIRVAGVGLSVTCGDAQGLRDALRAMRANNLMREHFGARARQLLEERYTRRAAVGRWQEVFKGIATDRD